MKLNNVTTSLLWRCMISYSAVHAAVLKEPSPFSNLSTAPVLPHGGGDMYPPSGPPGETGSRINCWVPVYNRPTIRSPSDCQMAWNLLLHEPGILEEQIFEVPSEPDHPRVPDFWEYGGCSIQLRYTTWNRKFTSDEFRYLDILNTTRRIFDFCINGIKEPQGGSAWIGHRKGYFVSVQGKTKPKSDHTDGSGGGGGRRVPEIPPLTPTRARPLGRRDVAARPSPYLPTPPQPSTTIHCYPSTAGKTTSVDGCRPTLQHLRRFYMPYSQAQVFQMFKRPPGLYTPPITHMHIRGSTCAIQMFCADARVEDRFSWKEVYSKATDVLQHCEDHGAGVGGWMNLGRGVGWKVVVLGVRVPDDIWVPNGVVGVGTAEGWNSTDLWASNTTDLVRGGDSSDGNIMTT